MKVKDSYGGSSRQLLWNNQDFVTARFLSAGNWWQHGALTFFCLSYKPNMKRCQDMPPGEWNSLKPKAFHPNP